MQSRIPNLRVLIASASVLTFAMGAHSQSPSQDTVVNDVLSDYVQYANEFSERRRFQVLFPNPQSEERGIQVDLVNVGLGNLTFRRRDIVTVGRIPVGMVRVYDSALSRSSTSFGPGWTWVGEENIRVRVDGSLVHEGENGVDTSFVEGAAGYVPVNALSSSIKQVTRIVDKHGFELLYRNGWRREYHANASATRYALARISDTYGNEVIFFRGSTGVTRVENSDGRWMEVTRAPDGRITLVTDDSGRSVSYEYDYRRRVISVNDLGGQPWTYSYEGASQRVIALVTPIDTTELSVGYADSGVVEKLDHSWRHLTFKYSNNLTRLTDAAGRVFDYVQASSGLTKSIVTDQSPSLEFANSKDQRSRSLLRGGAPVWKIEYGTSGAVERLEDYRSADGVRVTLFRHDEVSQSLAPTSERWESKRVAGRGVLLSDGEYHEYNHQGDLVGLSRGEGRWSIQYTDDGQPHMVQGPHGKTEFKYDRVGRLRRVEFPTGATHTYDWSDTGHRTRAILSSGAKATYGYDRAGRLVSVSRTLADGSSKQQRISLGSDNRILGIDYTPGSTADVTYDVLGNPRQVEVKGRSVEWRYDKSGRLESVVGWTGESYHYDYGVHEGDVREAWDDRTPLYRASLGNSAVYAQSLFGVTSARYAGVALMSVRAPSSPMTSLWSQDLLGLTTSQQPMLNALQRSRYLSTTAEADLLRPSNSIFLPPELFADNCELCNPGTQTIWVGGVSGGTHTVTSGESVAFNVTLGGCFGGPISEWDLDGNGSYETFGQTASHNYSTGSYTVASRVECPCDGSPTLTDTVLIVAQPPPPPPPPGDISVEYIMFIPLDHVRVPILSEFFDADGIAQWSSPSTRRIEQKFDIKTGSGTIGGLQNLSGLTIKYENPANLTSSGSCFRKTCPDCAKFTGLQEIIYSGQCQTGAGVDSATASNMSSMMASVSSSTSSSMTVAFEGNPTNALQVGSPGITWNLEIEIDWSSTPATWTLSGSHDGFPAHQIRINGDMAYQSHPVCDSDTPSDVDQCLSKTPLSLAPPNDVSVSKSGDL